ncbi:hypothetical protein AB1L42_03175 [Thalassoglobus sp. JC818]|uniref:hypothetical protein n=1 Tax=Thalassoglobus sp. JC818 TaxID=3232136 RepID=UPI003458D249
MRLHGLPVDFSSLSIRVFLVLTVLTAGCTQQLPREMEEIRSRLMVSEEPAEPITIEEARQLATEPTEVTLIVRVGNRNFPKWSAENQAIFYVSEAFPGSDYNVDADHDPSTCPFCKWKWKQEDSLATVTVTNAEGEIAPISADRLLGLNEGDIVVVRGLAEVDETEYLSIAATEIFKRTN